MRSRRSTIKDVAREAGVSVTTVSAALNGKGRVAPDTRQLIRDTAQQLNYSPSRSAAHLTSGGTGTLVFSVSPMTNEIPMLGAQPEWGIDYYFQVFNAANTEAFSHNFLMAMLPFHGPHISFLNSADGLLVVDPHDEDPLLEEAVNRGLPCVTIGRNNKGISWVDNDFFAATTSAIEHLNSSVSSAPALFLSETSSSYVRDEISAYLEWCLKASFDPAIIQAPGPRVDEAEAVITEALRDPNRRFDSVISTLDTLALATDHASRKLNIAIPDQIQILSLADSRYLSHNLQTSITALDLCPTDTAEAAINILMNEINGAKEHQNKIVETLLRFRESTHSPPTDNASEAE